MVNQFIQTPPPDERWFIVYESDMSIPPIYGKLTNSERSLGYNYDSIEIFVVKELWIARLSHLGIEYIEN